MDVSVGPSEGWTLKNWCFWTVVLEKTLESPMDCATCQAFLPFTISQSLLKLMSTESVMPSNNLILCHPLSSCLQSFPASGSFPMSRLFASSGQSVEASASASALPMNIQCWFPLGLTSLISLLSKRLSRVLQHHNSKTSILWCSAFFLAQLSHPYYGKNHSFD